MNAPPILAAPGPVSGPLQRPEHPRCVVALPTAAVQQDGALQVGGSLQDQFLQGLAQRGVVAALQKSGPGGHHLPVVPRRLGVHPVGGQEVDVIRRRPIKAVAGGTDAAPLLLRQRAAAQGAAEQTGPVHSRARM